MSSRDINDLTPATKALAQKLIDACAAAGVPIKLVCTYRSAAEQDAEYAKGRTAPGQIVTNLKGGQGIHETGQAFDIIPVNGGYAAPLATWDKIGSIGEGLGLEWGGNWKSFKDRPHFQLKGAKAGNPAPSSKPNAQPQPAQPQPTAQPQSEATAADKSSSSPQMYMVANLPPIPNRLHNYASYIYSLSLHMMTNEEYDNIVITQRYTPKNVIIASAGRHGADFQRNKNWTEDFYFENFSMKTIISPNDESRNTNAISCSFDIIEPYGFTLVERILKTTEELGGNNYLDMPYLVQIDFFAMDDAGEILGSIPELQKRFPVKFTKMGIKITEKGAEYSINAIPFGHGAFEGSAITVPANMEVTARTVADFFQSVEGTAADSLAQEMTAKTDLQQRQTQDQAAAQQNNAPSLLYSSLTKNATINVDSFGTAINAYWKGLKEAGKIAIADVYRFEFLPDPDTGQDVIGSAVFVEDKRNTPKETPMKKSDNVKDTISMRMSDIGSSQNTYDTSRGIFSINYGTAIDKLLEYVLRSSSYIHDQLVLPDGLSAEEYKARKDAMKDKPLKWFKIIPKVRLLGFDKIRKVWAKEYTYSVKPYKMYNLRSDIAPQGVIVNPVKAYNYLFTGQNSDIKHLDIIFNTLFYTQQTADRSNMGSENPTGDSINADYEYQNAPNYSGGDAPKGINYDAVMPLTMKPVVRDTKSTSAGNPSDAKSIGAADLAESIMSSSSADMLQIKMTIIGDPDYIKQDDIFYGPDSSQILTVTEEIDQRLLPDGGSLTMDDGGVYIQILFKIPRDIDDSTGFMKYQAEQRNSVFSGLYQVLSVVSTFSKGEFVQELTLTRMPRQIAFDYVGGNNNKSNARPDTENVASIPVISVTDVPQQSTANATDTAIDQTAGQNQAVAQANATTATGQTAEQKNLADVRKSADTTTITDQNKPQEVPTNPNAGEIAKLKEQIRDAGSDAAYYSSDFQTGGYVWLQKQADSFTKSIANQEAKIAAAEAENAPALADALKKDLIFFQNQRSKFSSQAAEAKAKYEETVAKQAQLQARLDTLQKA